MEQQQKPRIRLTDQEKLKILAELNKKFDKIICPLCQNDKFVISEGYFTHPISAEIGRGMIIGGLNVPTIALFCTNCGFMREFSLGVLGLMPNQQADVRIVREVRKG